MSPPSGVVRAADIIEAAAYHEALLEVIERFERQVRRRALDDALAAVRRLNGNGHDEPSDPALDAAEQAISRLKTP